MCLSSEKSLLLLFMNVYLQVTFLRILCVLNMHEVMLWILQFQQRFSTHWGFRVGIASSSYSFRRLFLSTWAFVLCQFRKKRRVREGMDVWKEVGGKLAWLGSNPGGAIISRGALFHQRNRCPPCLSFLRVLRTTAGASLLTGGLTPILGVLIFNFGYCDSY